MCVVGDDVVVGSGVAVYDDCDVDDMCVAGVCIRRCRVSSACRHAYVVSVCIFTMMRHANDGRLLLSVMMIFVRLLMCFADDGIDVVICHVRVDDVVGDCVYICVVVVVGIYRSMHSIVGIAGTVIVDVLRVLCVLLLCVYMVV